MKFVAYLFATFVTVLALFNTAEAGVNDFYFESFNAEYSLSKNNEGRSNLITTETLVAVFPSYNQNHGIERAIPTTYDGHTVNLKISSVLKGDGTAWNYTTYDKNGYKVIRIGDADTYVHGQQTYIISYTQQDVTKSFDTGDEWYWDVNGTEWLQKINKVTATLNLDSSLSASLDGQLACYTGVSGSTAQNCTISQNGTKISSSSNLPLGPKENLTMIVGFNKNTFAAYVAPPTPWWVWVIIVIAPFYLIALPIVVLIWGIRKWKSLGRDAKKIQTIVPEYIPPKDTSMLRADLIINTAMRPKAVSASAIDLAVRHYLKIYKTGKDKFEIEIVKPIDDLPDEDKKVINLLFGDNTMLNSKVNLKDLSNKYNQITSIGKEVYSNAINQGLMSDTRAVQKKINIVAGILIAIGFLTFNIPLVIVCSILFFIASKMPARTAKGVGLYNYLQGTKMYMEVAEAERLKVLQSPDSVVTLNPNDPTQVVKLYERLLPLAVLFNIEKKWAEEFSKLYTPEYQPYWYQDRDAAMFNAIALGAVVNSFSSSTVSTFSPPSNSSSSGFSGGGSSGGGGGGGGGGGW